MKYYRWPIFGWFLRQRCRGKAHRSSQNLRLSHYIKRNPRRPFLFPRKPGRGGVRLSNWLSRHRIHYQESTGVCLEHLSWLCLSQSSSCLLVSSQPCQVSPPPAVAGSSPSTPFLHDRKHFGQPWISWLPCLRWPLAHWLHCRQLVLVFSTLFQLREFSNLGYSYCRELRICFAFNWLQFSRSLLL